MRRRIHLYLNIFVYREFASICKRFGVKVCDALEGLMKDFIEKHKDQLPLDYFIAEEKAKHQITYFDFTQNYNQSYNIILAKIAKIDPQRWITELKTIDPDRLEPRQAEFWKEKSSELIVRASKALEEIRLTGYNTEYAELLQDLINLASEILQKLLKRSRGS